MDALEIGDVTFVPMSDGNLLVEIDNKLSYGQTTWTPQGVMAALNYLQAWLRMLGGEHTV